MPKNTKYLTILSQIAGEQDGLCVAVLAQRLKTKKQNIEYYIRLLRNDGMIRQDYRGRIAPYIATEKGLKLVAIESKKLLSGRSEIFTPKLDNVHNLSFRIEIKDPKPIYLPNKVQMRGWLKSFDWLGDVLLTRYGDTSIEVRFKIECSNPYEAESRAWQKVHRFVEQIEKAYGIALGQPIMNRKPHYTHIGDTAVEELSRKAITYVKDVGHIDRSNDTSHIEYYTPELSRKYIEMPVTLEAVLKTIEMLSGLIVKMTEAQIKTADGFQKLVERLSPQTPPPQPAQPAPPEKEIEGYR